MGGRGRSDLALSPAPKGLSIRVPLTTQRIPPRCTTHTHDPNIRTPHPQTDPIVILPIYRSPTTTDWTRLFIACVVHPIVQEFVMTVQRTKIGFTEEELELVVGDPKMHYHALGSMGSAYNLEYIMVMYRRVMIGCMIDASASIVAVVFTAMEEALLRSTMVYRDRFFAWLQGLSEPTEAELEHKVCLLLIVRVEEQMREPR